MNSMKSYYLIFISILFVVSLLQSCSKYSEEVISQKVVYSNLRNIFALGDSLTAWYGLDIDSSYPAQLEKKLQSAGYAYKVINAGISWNTSAELLARLEWTLTDAQAWDIVIFVIGGNDGLRGMSLEDMKENILSMISVAKEKELKVVLSWMQIPPNLWQRYASDFRQVYYDIAAQDSDIYFQEFFLEDVASVRKYNLSDGIHPNAEWYTIIVNNLFSFLVDKQIIWY